MSGKASAEEHAQHAKEQGKKPGAEQSNQHNAEHIKETRPLSESTQKDERSRGSSSGSGQTHADRVHGGKPENDH